MEELCQSYEDFQLLRTLVEIKPTRCEWGVFAKTEFSECDFVGQVDGMVIEDAGYCSEYCMEMDHLRSIEPLAPFRYLNHSCEPNCQITGDEPAWRDTPIQPLFIQAIREIRIGEELTIDYAWPADMAMQCLCNSSGCRGWIVDLAEISLVTRPQLSI